MSAATRFKIGPFTSLQYSNTPLLRADLPIHKMHDLGRGGGHVGIVRGDDECGLFLGAKTLEQFHDFTAGVGIQIARQKPKSLI